MPYARLLPLLPLLLICTAGTARAERWYQVELLVFSHELPSATEQWPATPALSYPDALQRLFDPLAPKPILPDAPLEQEATDIPRLGEPLAAAPETPEPPTTPSPYSLRPGSEQEFRGKAAYMQRTGNFQVLFHESWVQPIGDEGDALPILVESTQQLDGWPRLQGSVTLHLSRFLHLDTNLWLNTRGDYLPGQWRMPPPPMTPPDPALVAAAAAAEESLLPATEPAEPAPAEVAAESALLEDTGEVSVGPIYPWRHAVKLEQRRKMRSNEVHYIDHPLLGVVAKLTPLDEEQLRLLAEEEAALLAATAAGAPGA